MSSKYIALDYTVAAGEGMDILLVGTSFRFLSSTGTVDLDIGFDGSALYPLPVGVGLMVPTGFSKVRVRNPGAGATTFTIAVAEGATTDNRQSGAVSVSNFPGLAAAISGGTVMVGVAAAVVAAANANRKSVTIRNEGTATIYLGPVGVTTANGLPVDAAGSFTFDGSTAAIYGISGVAGQNVRWLEEA